MSTDAPPRLSALARLRSILGGSAGNLVEWYDWYAYSVFAIYFAHAFFPKADSTARFLDAAAVFALGFFARPLGAWLLAAYADKRGRKASLMLSVSGMCLGSLAVALCPTFAQAGVLSPTLLILARLLQGFSLGGEYGTSATYLSEMAGARHRGFWSSFQYMTLISGQILALLLLALLRTVLSPAQLEAWGWRIPFAVGALLAVTVFWLRRRIEETQAFHSVEHQDRGKTIWLFLRHPKETAIVLGLTAGGTAAFYTFTTYMQTFLVNTAGFSKDRASAINLISLIAMMAFQPLVGFISDKIGRKPVLIAFGVLGVAFTWPILSALAHVRTDATALLLVLASLAILSCYTAINAVVKAELFPPEIRAVGVALPYAVANALFGGTAEYVALAFKHAGHENWFYGYVTAIIAVSLAVYVFMRDTRRHSRIVEG
jgi:MHS family alpha-ketoglutarate permease-like MFS transporter